MPETILGQNEPQGDPQNEPQGEPQNEPQGEPQGGEPQGAPEKYEIKFTEGFTHAEEQLESFYSVAKESGLSNDAAQNLFDMGMKMVEDTILETKQGVEKLREDWVTEVKSDSEIGGHNLEKTVATAVKALNTFGTPELTELLDVSGLGDNPEVIRFLYNVGKNLGGSRLAGGQPAGGPKEITPKDFYPNSPELK